MKDNGIEQKINKKTITVHGKYNVPETNKSVQLPNQLNTIVMSIPMPSLLLPQQNLWKH